MLLNHRFRIELSTAYSGVFIRILKIDRNRRVFQARNKVVCGYWSGPFIRLNFFIPAISFRRNALDFRLNFFGCNFGVVDFISDLETGLCWGVSVFFFHFYVLGYFNLCLDLFSIRGLFRRNRYTRIHSFMRNRLLRGKHRRIIKIWSFISGHCRLVNIWFFWCFFFVFLVWHFFSFFYYMNINYYVLLI